MGIFKQIITDANLSQGEIASRLGCTEANLSHLKSKPSPFMGKVENAMRILGLEEINSVEGTLQITIKTINK